MAKQRGVPSAPPAKVVTSERAARLYRLLKFLGARPRTREAVAAHLGLGVRGFYRDLELLRHSGIEVPLVDRRYTLRGNVEEALARLPLPDPHLTLGEALELAKGRGRAHRKLKAQLALIVGRRK
jgi:predicted DNA-binding transcriptional regulator YafY